MVNITKLLRDVEVLDLLRHRWNINNVYNNILQTGDSIPLKSAHPVEEVLLYLKNIEKYPDYEDIVKEIKDASDLEMNIAMPPRLGERLLAIIPQMTEDIDSIVVSCLSSLAPINHGVDANNLISFVLSVTEKKGDETKNYLLDKGITSSIDSLSFYQEKYRTVATSVKLLMSQLSACIDIDEVGGHKNTSFYRTIGLITEETVGAVKDVLRNRNATEIDEVLSAECSDSVRVRVHDSDEYTSILINTTERCSEISGLIRKDLDVLVSVHDKLDSDVSHAQDILRRIIWLKTRLDILTDVISEIGNDINEAVDAARVELAIEVKDIPEDVKGE